MERDSDDERNISRVWNDVLNCAEQFRGYWHRVAHPNPRPHGGHSCG